MSAARVLTFGYDRRLVELRSRVLRMSGYEVDETFTLPEASAAAQSDLIDALVICHTVPMEEREKLISVVRQTRKLMPILCIRAHHFEPVTESCVAAENLPTALLDSLNAAIRAYNSPRAGDLLAS